MITRITLEFFKCFRLLKLPLAPLTLLSGQNASGKSSVLQSLVLLHQTMDEHEWSTRLMLNGSSVQLGTVSEVVDELYGRRELIVGISTDEVDCFWQFAGERDDMSMIVEKVSLNSREISKPEKLRYLLPVDENELTLPLSTTMRRLTYITAERLGPREIYSHVDPRANNTVGPKGEFAISKLYSGRDDVILEELVIRDLPPTLLRQTIARMAVFFPEFSLEVKNVSNTNEVTLGIRTTDMTGFHRPIHAGFGITQVLPLVVATLSASVNDIIIIENPEVHLHPAGQAAMGQFLSEVAQAGIQVIIESHSDHILNGIRRSVKAGVIEPEQVVVHFFNNRELDGPQVISPHIDILGMIDDWPEGFFDQFDKDMIHFVGWDF